MFSQGFIRGLNSKKDTIGHSTSIWTSSSLSWSWILIFFCASDSMSGIVCVSLMAQIVFSFVETLKVSFSGLGMILQRWLRN